jgi:lysophospholipase L1-like esterase
MGILVNIIYNRGIGNDTTEGLKTRLNNSIFDLKPHTVVLLIVTNDLALLQTSPLKVATNIKEIIKSVKEKLPNVKIILQSIYPVNADLSPMTVLPRQNKDIKAINDLISKIDDVTYVDLYSKLELDGKLNPKYSVEGLHINEEGYELITHELKLHLK